MPNPGDFPNAVEGIVDMLDDTIVAISTPLGEGGISIVRLSGQQALAIADEIFQGQIRPSESPTHHVHYGRTVDPDSGEPVDEVLLTVMRAPKTYTREDVVEINCHGGLLVAKRILEIALNCGARLAEPGEFTKRAFLNGRIDLAQAEAAVDLIRSKTETGLRSALSQLNGRLSAEVERLRQDLVELCSLLEVAIDFPEEDIEFTDRERLLSMVDGSLERLEGLIKSSEAGKVIREGLAMVIVGKPNVGKSSLLNALLKEDRAIVTPLPGTTRDTVEEILDIGGIPIRVVDTAGLREPQDVIELEGNRRAETYLKGADLVLFVVDGSVEIDQEDRRIAEKVRSKKAIAVVNKIDLEQRIDGWQVGELIEAPLVKFSALKMIGLGALERAMLETIFQDGFPSTDGALVTNVRHRRALIGARNGLVRAQEALTNGLSGEFVTVDIREALDCLGEITGETTTEDILERIFSEFCIGK